MTAGRWPACGAPTKAGTPCPNRAELCPEPDCRRCVSHCDHRKALAKERRLLGARNAARQRTAAAAKVVKTVELAELPVTKVETLDDAILLAAWASVAVLTGQIDQRVAQVCSKLLDTLKNAFHARDAVQAVAALKDQVAQLKRARGAP